MARIAIPFSGITTHPNHKDGECRTLVNLRPKEGGVRKPVPPRKEVQELSQEYDIVFVHRGNGYENWVGIVNGVDYSTVYNGIRNTPASVANINERVNSIQQIGNTLTLVTGSNLYYLLWQHTGYRFLGELPELPVISFKTSDEMTSAKMYFENEYGENGVNSVDLVTATKGLVNKTIDIMINGGMINGEYHSGTPLLFDAYYIRYAFRLYDGSLTKHSPPILVIPTRRVAGDERVYRNGDNPYLGNDSIKYMEYAITLDGTVNTGSYIYIFGYKIGMWYDTGLSGDYSQWTDIIKSVDIFMSAPLGLSNIENIRNDMPTWSGQGWFRCNLIKGIPDNAAKNLRENGTFYFVKSIGLGDWKSVLNPEMFPETNDDKFKISNIIYQEEMTDDPFSYHKTGAKTSNVLNNRLYLSGIKTTFFNGFNAGFFQWYSKYNGVEEISASYTGIVSEVEINTGTRIEKVYSALYGMFDSAPDPFFSALISYPDPRARKMTIYRIDGTDWQRVLQFNLTEHPSLNLAYFLSDNLNPIIASLEQPVPIPPVIGGRVSIEEANKIRISEVNNPFLFPTANTYQIGSGEIYNLSSIVMNVSDRNYGMYPVFVFTSDGVFSLSASDGDSVHSNLQAPAYGEPPVSDVVCATPYGVAFITKRGLMIINQHKTDFISDQLREDAGMLSLQDIGIDSPLTDYPGRSFTDFLSGVDLMLYNPYHDELIIVDRESEYNYIYDFTSKSFYLSTEKFNQLVQNSFPDIYILDGRKLKDFARVQSKAAEVAIVTRPLSFGTTDAKKLERVMLRGLLYNLNNASDKDKAVVAAYYSDDSVNFEVARGLRIRKNGSYKDFDMGLFARVKYRSYLFLFAGTMDEDSEVRYLEIETDKEYDNEKMR